MKIKRGFNYALVLTGILLLFTASYLQYGEIGLAAGFVLLMAGLYRLSLKTGEPRNRMPEKDTDE
jgi:hypothetical protein